MTDRIAAFVVVLDQDIRDDDIEPVLTALRMTRHVLSVEPQVVSADTHIAESRAYFNARTKVYDALGEAFDEMRNRGLGS